MLKIALAGNPNCGKTTLFNALTGSSAHVGNWAGVTVEHTSGIYKSKKSGEQAQIIDLPGIYSISPYTPEEIVSRKFIIDENPDLIIDIVDASNLERNLYLTTQLMEIDCPIVIALNMMDVALKQGVNIDVPLLSSCLGLPAVPISAARNEGIDELMQTVFKTAREVSRKGVCICPDNKLRRSVYYIADILSKNGCEHPVFHAVKLIEGDEIEVKDHKELMFKVEGLRSEINLKPELAGDFEAAIADMRYDYITGSLKKSFTTAADSGKPTLTDRIDRVFTHKVFGIPIFLGIMLLIFHITFSSNFFFTGAASPGVFLQSLVASATEWISGSVSQALSGAGASAWLNSLIVDGIISGVGAVLTFLPQILLLFLFLSVLEDTGYMARGAFLMDRILKKFGLSGKAFMPILMGFGCSVPAMMGARTLESEKERRMTIFLIPFFSCGAKMPIWATFSAAVFPKYADLVVMGIYLTGVITAVIAAVILKNTVLKAHPSPFALEMPAYHLPRVKNLAIHVWDKMKDFLSRAATVIFGATVVIWLLSNFTFGFEQVANGSADSMLGVISSWLVPIFKPLGFGMGKFGWCAVVSILTGLIAREMVVSSLGVLLGEFGSLAAGITAVFSPAAALSFMVFNLLAIPCMASVATARAELKSRKWFLGALAFWFSVAWIVAFAVYWVGRLILG